MYPILVYTLHTTQHNCCVLCSLDYLNQEIGIKWKGNGAGLAWESQSHCFADKFGITHAHSFGTDTQHDYGQGNFFRVLISK